MIHPEVQGALIGVGAMSIAHIGKMGFDYLMLKLNKNGKNKNGFCKEHYKLVEILNRLVEHYKEERQISLYKEAIKQVNKELLNGVLK